MNTLDHIYTTVLIVALLLMLNCEPAWSQPTVGTGEYVLTRLDVDDDGRHYWNYQSQSGTTIQVPFVIAHMSMGEGGGHWGWGHIVEDYTILLRSSMEDPQAETNRGKFTPEGLMHHLNAGGLVLFSLDDKGVIRWSRRWAREWGYSKLSGQIHSLPKILAMTLAHTGKTLCVYKEMPMEDEPDIVNRGCPGYVATVNVYDTNSGDPIAAYEVKHETGRVRYSRRFGYAASVPGRDIDVVAFADAVIHAQELQWYYLLVDRNNGAVLDTQSTFEFSYGARHLNDVDFLRFDPSLTAIEIEQPRHTMIIKHGNSVVLCVEVAGDGARFCRPLPSEP